jgi:uncharacterized repeat protein (TIGR03803 family)
MKLLAASVLAATMLVTNGLPVFGQTLTTVATFNGPNGSDPQGGLVLDASGNLYGTTFNGGQYGAGTIFEVDAAAHTLTTLFSFNGADGGEPDASLAFGADGNLYGTSRIGGTFSSGTVFSFSPWTRSLTTLASFDGGVNGGFPLAPVALDSAGNIYGTTSSGGGIVAGTVFEVDANTHALTTLYGFPSSGIKGAAPTTGLVLGPNGSLIGTTAAGGANNQGTLFNLSTSKRAITTLATFGPATGGPPSSVLIAADGKMYGTTEFGGLQNNGGIFEFTPSTQALTMIALFHGADGSDPSGGVIMDADRILYGTTSAGGLYNGPVAQNGDGTVFEFDPLGGEITSLASFVNDGAGGPNAGLITDGRGNFFGTTTGGGEFGCGTVFELSTPEPTAFAILAIATLSACTYRARGRRQ